MLEAFIKLATQLNKPLILHAVYEDAPIVCDLLEKHTIKKAHFHWFKGNDRIIERLISNHYYISITPDVMYKERTRHLVKLCPIDQLMVETDGPWPFEGPYASKMTHPKMIHDMIETIATIKNMSVSDVYPILYNNTKSFYH